MARCSDRVQNAKPPLINSRTSLNESLFATPSLSAPSRSYAHLLASGMCMARELKVEVQLKSEFVVKSLLHMLHHRQ